MPEEYYRRRIVRELGAISAFRRGAEGRAALGSRVIRQALFSRAAYAPAASQPPRRIAHGCRFPRVQARLYLRSRPNVKVAATSVERNQRFYSSWSHAWSLARRQRVRSRK